MNAAKQLNSLFKSPYLRNQCGRIVFSRISCRPICCSNIRKFHITSLHRFSGDIQEINMRPQVYVTRPDYASVGMEILGEECDLTFWNQACPVPRDELLKNVGGKDGIFCALTEKIDVELLDQAGPNLKVVSTISVGYDHIDVAECKKRGIRVGYTPDVLTDATAELTMALLLATGRRLLEANKEVYNGGWQAWEPAWMCGPGIKGSTVGLVGFGRIAQEVARRLVPFKPSNILYHSRTNHPYEAEKVGAERVSFDELLMRSDYVIVLCALTAETHHIIDAEALAKMRPTAILINTSRGGCVDQDALFDALQSGQIRAAGLDVTTPEPLPLNSPLLTLRNIVLLPHIGSADITTRQEMSRVTACNILAGLKGIKMISEL
ncbi:glyoxylate reductase/hydroxypyruvate reductase isoform X1 [Lutzomyia longipalpis]|uniref:glyoxylate reductase/hydroxypyruvate reductase isoform X1 n=2 Tax=Lutzomyia longipalpis TaxID=7200 RepID=UPI0024834CB5|nr:glyoxylate reductase/hydroxypyruvate reductase isoform X1 [Lutzomyia longipalpis]